MWVVIMEGKFSLPVFFDDWYHFDSHCFFSADYSKTPVPCMDDLCNHTWLDYDEGNSDYFILFDINTNWTDFKDIRQAIFKFEME